MAMIAVVIILVLIVIGLIAYNITIHKKIQKFSRNCGNQCIRTINFFYRRNKRL